MVSNEDHHSKGKIEFFWSLSRNQKAQSHFLRQALRDPPQKTAI